ncbi:hypothetical protein HYS47_03960 [Candidatus Woesearchaeota archaeon]|nr:hypothetical protein [Candidatus Woesearchaeota archaeon]
MGDNSSDQAPDAQDLATLLGAGPYMALRHQSSTAILSKLIDDLVGTPIPDSSKPISHETYLQARDHLSRLTTLAAIAGNKRLDLFVGQWATLQKNYAKQVITKVKEGVDDLQERLETCDLELADAATVQQAYDKMKELGLDKKLYENLERRVNEQKRIANEQAQLKRTISGVSKVEQTLATLIESGMNSVHYRILSVQEAQEQLGKDEYTGPLFEPLFVSTKAESTVRDIFMRTAAAPVLRKQDASTELQMNGDMPDVLKELVIVYDYVTAQKPGTIINPSRFRPQLGLEALGAKGIGSYLEDNFEVFGVQLRDAQGSRTFIRQDTGAPMDKKSFLQHMLGGKLQGPDAKTVNDFYFAKALSTMRERPEAYTGFTKDHLIAIAENKGYPLSSMYVARHINNHGDRYGLTYVREPEGQTPAEVKFAKVEPTETQIGLCREAAASYGTTRFVVGGKDDELVRRVHELHPESFISPRVTEEVMSGHAAGWGYRVASMQPLQYQREDFQRGDQTAKSGQEATPAATGRASRRSGLM